MNDRDITINGAGPYVITGFGVVHPWLCDAMGHLTTRNYVGFFDDASWHLLAEIGYGAAAARVEQWGWADVRNEILYRAEVRAGALISGCSRVTALGVTSLTLESVLQDRETQSVAATMTAKLVCFDLGARSARPLPDAIRQHAVARFGLANFVEG